MVMIITDDTLGHLCFKLYSIIDLFQDTPPTPLVMWTLVFFNILKKIILMAKTEFYLSTRIAGHYATFILAPPGGFGGPSAHHCGPSAHYHRSYPPLRK